MKKILCSFFIFLLFPINIFAYSNYIVPGGESIGIKIESDGLVIVGFYKVNNEYIAKKTLKIGDRIISINGNEINSINDLTDIVDKNINDNNLINITIIRNDKIINTTLELYKEDNVYKTGLYVKDSVIGLGTLSYIDPITKVYGALGHEINLSETNDRIEVKNGNILLSKVTKIDRSSNGNVGSKNANISYNKKIGTIVKNTNRGIYGMYTSNISNNTLEIGTFNEIHKGDAYILTVIKGDNVEKYTINIVDKYQNKKDTQKSFSFEINDKTLLSKTGGVVQGMSGSPIIQDNKIIGAVTNVVIDNVKLGYAINIEAMLEEGDKILQ